MTERWEETLASLRRDFDATFAAPPPEPAADLAPFLLGRAGADPIALRLAEVAGLAARRKVVPLPGTPPALLGIAGVRGRLVPVYDLAALLGGRRDSGAAPRWLVLHGREDPVGLALDAFEGYEAAAPGALAGDTLRTASGVRRVVSIPSILPRKEHGP